MKKLFVLIVIALLFSSCVESRPMLYNWGYKSQSQNATTYETLLYENYHKQSPESICTLLCQYETMVTNPGGLRKTVPPGICAEYGYLLLSPETAEAFSSSATKKQRETMGASSNYGASFREKGLQMLEMEMELYPESSVFIQPLIQKFRQQ